MLNLRKALYISNGPLRVRFTLWVTGMERSFPLTSSRMGTDVTTANKESQKATTARTLAMYAIVNWNVVMNLDSNSIWFT